MSNENGVMTSDVVLRHVDAGYGETLALEDISLDVPRGSLVAVVGPNGAGKSTLLKLIAGLLKPWRGEVTVLGATPGEHAHHVAYVPQAEMVDWAFPGHRVAGGDDGPLPAPRPVEAPWTRRCEQPPRRPSSGWACRTSEIDRSEPCRAASGRRVFLARAMAADAQLFLLDEPVTAIDPVTQDDIMDALGGGGCRRANRDRQHP